LFLGCVERLFSVVFAIFCYFDCGLRDGPMVVEFFLANVGFVGKLLVVDGFAIGCPGVGDIRALHLHKKLAFLYGVIETDVNLNDATTGERDHRDGAADVGSDRTGGCELRGSFDLFGGLDGEEACLGRCDSDEVHVLHLRHTRRRRRTAGVVVFLLARREEEAYRCDEADCDGLITGAVRTPNHGITSRPTARLSWLAAVR